MVRITIGTTLETRPQEIYESSTTVREALEKFTADTGVDYNKGIWNINGTVVRDFDKSFEEMGYDGKDIFLLNVANTKNA